MKTKDSFIPFMPTSALSLMVSIIVSCQGNIIYLDWFVMQITWGVWGGEVFYNVQAFCISQQLKSIYAFKYASHGSCGGEMVIVVKSLQWGWFRSWLTAVIKNDPFSGQVSHKKDLLFISLQGIPSALH